MENRYFSYRSLNVVGVSGCATTYGLGELSAQRGETNNGLSGRVLLLPTSWTCGKGRWDVQLALGLGCM